jgi:RiboL-PSP-HEPN
MRPLLPTTVAADMRRLSVVMAVAALDTYMHSLVVTRAYTQWPLPGGLARLEVPFEALLAQADEAKEAARRRPHKSRPRVGVKRQLRDRLLRETFQSYDGVSRALGMAGLSKRWEKIGKQMSPEMEPSEIKLRLDEIVTRRNQIVHEGDYERKERPRKAKTTPMSQSQARGDIDFIAQLVDAIHGVI